MKQFSDEGIQIHAAPEVGIKSATEIVRVDVVNLSEVLNRKKTG